MAGVSIYENENSKKSIKLGKQFKDEVFSLSLEEVENLQMRFGVSNVELSQTLGISMATISRWKTGKTELAKYYKVNIYCYFKYLEAFFWDFD